MRKRGLWRYSKLMLLAAFITMLGMTSTAFADSSTSSSTHYQVDDTGFNAGVASESCSSTYCSQSSVGDLIAGSSASGSDSAKFGAVTNSHPELEVIVGTTGSDVGTLSTTSTATKSATIQVLSYLSDGYILQIMGDPPKYNGHTLAALTTPTQSIPGTEQFGMNVVANTDPVVGADPVQTPSGETSFGVPNAGYNTANQFKYNSGDIIAHSSTSSGITDYTISMIVNISNSTSAGHYSGDFSAVVTPVF